MRNGNSHLNYSAYHDHYQRTPDGWKFTERVDDIKYLDTSGWRARLLTQRPGPSGSEDRLGTEP
jgi:hypothetical protein